VTVPLTPSLLESTRSLLERRPLHNLYFLAMLDRLASTGRALEGRMVARLGEDGTIAGAADCGRNLVFELRDESDGETVECLAEAAATIEKGRHALVGVRHLAAAFHRAYERRGARVLTIREQILYSVGRETIARAPDREVRTPRLAELDEVLRVHAAMCLEDLGHDQVAENPHGYRQYFRQLIRDERVWVMSDRGRIVFKAESAIESASAAQVEGVYTDPAFRREGRARAGLSRVCLDLLARVPRVTLYVNEGNRPAISLYRSLGFRPIADWRTTVFWKD
jgi:predicted GNAT family acetyltransferase